MERTTKKESYQQMLLERCQEWWTKYETSIDGSQLIEFDWPKSLCDFVRQVALESFKNGVAAGRRRGSERLDGSRQSGKVS